VPPKSERTNLATRLGSPSARRRRGNTADRVARSAVVLSANYLEGVLTTDQKGGAAELAIAHAAAELGVGVLKPLTDGERYDLISTSGRN
jgi:PD-(D/E)XK endonuclease